MEKLGLLNCLLSDFYERRENNKRTSFCEKLLPQSLQEATYFSMLDKGFFLEKSTLQTSSSLITSHW